MGRVISDFHPLLAPRTSRSPKFRYWGIIHTFASKVLFTLLAPFALLGGYGLLRGLYLAEEGQSAIGDAALAGYILLGLMLWIALLAVTDLPGGGQIITRLVWGAHDLLNLLAVPFWLFWQPSPNHSAMGFQGLGFLALLAIFPVLAISSICFVLSFTNTKSTP